MRRRDTWPEPAFDPNRPGAIAAWRALHDPRADPGRRDRERRMAALTDDALERAAARAEDVQSDTSV
jgi:hypothetical protein